MKKKKPSEKRRWVRHHMRGDAAWIEDNPDEPGKPHVRLDRPGAAKYARYTAGEWPDDKERRPISTVQKARVCHAADAMFMQAVQRGTAKSWEDLSREQMKKWIEVGPQGDPVRKKLYASICKVLDHLT